MCPLCNTKKPLIGFSEQDLVGKVSICYDCCYKAQNGTMNETEYDSEEKNNERVCKVCWGVLGERYDVCCVHCCYVINTINKNKNTLGMLISLSTLK